MIAAIKGKVYALWKTSIILSCSNGLFDEIFLPDPTLTSMKVKSEVTLLTWIKRDNETLSETMYGCKAKEDKVVFMDLISVSGVGPKTAMIALGFPMDLLRENIGKGNWAFFQTLPRIGMTTAKKIVFELQKKYMGKK